MGSTRVHGCSGRHGHRVDKQHAHERGTGAWHTEAAAKPASAVHGGGQSHGEGGEEREGGGMAGRRVADEDMYLEFPHQHAKCHLRMG